jgi:YVTN family beta-propeller protein
LKPSIFAIALLASLGAAAQVDSDKPVRSVLDPGVITTRQAITPAGIQTVFQARVYGLAFGESPDVVYALTAWRKSAQVFKLDWRTNRVLESTRSSAMPGMQSIAFDKKGARAVIAGLGGKTGVQVAAATGPKATVLAENLGRNAVGGIAAAPDGTLLVALTFNNELAIIDPATGAARKVKTGIAPFTAIANSTSTEAWVTNWAGRFPRPGEPTAPTGPQPGADQVVVDARGIAASGTVSRVDLKSGTLLATLEVGLHPTGLSLDEAHNRLYIANSNSDSVTVIDTKRNAVVSTIPIQPFERKIAGVAPESLVASKDGRRLYVACAGINAVAVIALTTPARVEGLIPTAWYPNHIALSNDGKLLAVSTMLGVGSGSRGGANERVRLVHSNRGTLHVIPIPEATQLAGYSLAVAENNRLRLHRYATPILPPRPGVKPLPVPERAGEPSLIEHIVYIVKENRSYDQTLGDLAHGNGDASLHLLGDDIIPNQRKLAREFVLLDNFMATGGNSADGHQWVTQAAETDYTLWPGYGGRSYPKNGDDPMAFARSGFLWDNAIAHGRSFVDFGEFVGAFPVGVKNNRLQLLEEFKAGEQFLNRFHTVAPIAPLNKYLVKDYPHYSLDVPDVVRARIFLRHFEQMKKTGKMPHLMMIQLPSDHTSGTKPDYSTPKACFADNDWATGQIVEALSHSPFWKKMLILIVEDDAQSGADHVDGHRTIAQAISPYTRRRSVDSTFYSQTSMAKTIELILGLPAMNLFDLIANDMRNAFTTTPDFTPFTAEVPKQSIYEANPKLNALKGEARRAAASTLKMNFRDPDSAPTHKVNRMIWASIRGWDSPYPQPKRATFMPFAPPDDDEDDDE